MGLNRMSGKKDKKPSLHDVALKAGTDRNRVAAALRDDPDLPKAFKDKVKKAVEAVGYVKPPPNQHPNSKLDQEKADAIVDGIVQNKSITTIANEVGLDTETASKYIRGVKVPKDYPDNEDDWRKDVTGFLEVAIWKGTKRLAENSMHFIDDRSLPVAVAVLVDKLAATKGQPTSIHLSMTASVSHRDLMKDLKDRDVTPVNDEQTHDLV
jgi:hypothetical protein